MLNMFEHLKIKFFEPSGCCDSFWDVATAFTRGRRSIITYKLNCFSNAPSVVLFMHCVQKLEVGTIGKDLAFY